MTVATSPRKLVGRLALSPDAVAHSLGVRRDFLDEHIGHEIKFVRRGRRKLPGRRSRFVARSRSIASPCG